MNELVNVPTSLTLQNTILKQFILTFVTLFSELCHLLQHGLISTTTWSVPIADYYWGEPERAPHWR